MGAFFLVDDQGAFAALKEKLRFSEPLQGSRVRQAKKIKVSRRGVVEGCGRSGGFRYAQRKPAVFRIRIP